MDKLLTIRAVADVLSVSRGTVYRLLHDGELEAVTVGNRWRVRESDLACEGVRPQAVYQAPAQCIAHQAQPGW